MISQNVSFLQRIGVAVAALGLVFAAVGRADAQASPLQVGAQGGSASLPPSTPYSYVFLDHDGETAKPEQGNSLNVKMHGHWVIDVKNPDGSIAQHRDLENTIQGGGAAYLISLMAGYSVPSDYEIYLTSTGTTPCVPPGSLQGCAIVHSLSTVPGSTTCANYYCAVSLTYGVNQNYSVTASNSLVLSGQFTANRAGTLDGVQTYVGTCPYAAIPSPSGTLGTVTPATCSTLAQPNGTAINALSAASITSVPVAINQIVQVTVTISFS